MKSVVALLKVSHWLQNNQTQIVAAPDQVLHEIDAAFEYVVATATN